MQSNIIQPNLIEARSGVQLCGQEGEVLQSLLLVSSVGANSIYSTSKDFPLVSIYSITL